MQLIINSDAPFSFVESSDNDSVIIDGLIDNDDRQSKLQHSRCETAFGSSVVLVGPMAFFADSLITVETKRLKNVFAGKTSHACRVKNVVIIALKTMSEVAFQAFCMVALAIDAIAFAC